MAMTLRTKQMLHVQLNGRCQEVSLEELQLTRHATDAQIKAAITRHFALPAHQLDQHIIVRSWQARVIHPEAYGVQKNGSPCS